MVEHVRLQARDSLKGLPGLDLAVPSRVRDAVTVAIHAGAPFVDVVLARVEGLKPWDLDRPEVIDALDPFLSGLYGAALVFPDLGGPLPVGPGTAAPMEERVDRFVRAVALHGPRWVERYQIGLLDHPGAEGEEENRLLEGAFGYDVSICRWRGGRDPLRAHAWRSAAAIVGGIVAFHEGEVAWGLAGQTVNLPQGRIFARDRQLDLSVGRFRYPEFQDNHYFVDVVPDEHGRARVVSEAGLRLSLGEWSVPAMRTAKAIHWRIMHAASRFVFESADEGQAFALASAVTHSVSPFTSRGVLTGAGGEGPPIVRGSVVRIPGEHGLRVDITAQLRPWAQNVAVRVSLRPGAQPVLEDAA